MNAHKIRENAGDKPGTCIKCYTMESTKGGGLYGDCTVKDADLVMRWLVIYDKTIAVRMLGMHFPELHATVENVELLAHPTKEKH